MLPSIHDIFDLTPRVFGYVCFVHNLGPHVQKFDAKVMKGIFLRHSSTQKWYKYYIHSSGKWNPMKDVIFFEEKTFYLEDTP